MSVLAYALKSTTNKIGLIMHLLFRLNKGKGILVLLYFIVSSLVTAELVGLLERNVGGIFASIDTYTTIGISFLLASIWTHQTKDDYYKDREGNKIKMDTVNSFIFIKMKTWAIIFFFVAFIFFGIAWFHYFSPVAF